MPNMINHHISEAKYIHMSTVDGVGNVLKIAAESLIAYNLIQKKHVYFKLSLPRAN